MVVKLFWRKPSNLIRYAANGFLKRRFSDVVNVPANEYKYLLVLDFEATCEKKKIPLQEIIEFPCLKVNMKTMEEEARFHYYVRPVYSPILSEFCIQLTGILQEIVDESPTFPEVFRSFEEWRRKEGITAVNSLYVTSGDWDLGHMIRVQCRLCGIERPSHMLQWADLKKLIAKENSFVNSFADILKLYGLTFKGRPHSGIDDCLNMLRVIRRMKLAGMEFKPTSLVDTSTSRVINISTCEQQAKEGPQLSKVLG